MAYRFVEENQEEFGLRWLLQHMRIHPNAYYNYLRQAKKEYHQQKKSACEAIKDIYHELNGVIGHRAMKIFLARKGIKLSKTTIHKYMNKELQLYSICRRKKPGYKKGHAHKLHPNLLNQNFQVEIPNKIWCTDFTYLFLSTGSVRYNCTVIDLYDRSVVASITDKWLTSDLAIRTVQKAIQAANCNPNGLVLHSDQGSQFTSLEFNLFCRDAGLKQSMSRAGCPYDNAPMERYFNTLKSELIYQYRFDTDEELNYAIAEYAYNWYNQIRPHSYDGYQTPFEKRRSVA